MIAVVVAILFIVPVLLQREARDQELSQGKNKEDNACEWVVMLEGEEMPLEKYVAGVVAGEMPAVYELEALKAQAIAARTYALYKLQNETGQLKATVAHQVFYDGEQRAERWQDEAEKYEAKVQRAVKETEGKIITYNGEPISAMFHAASNGKTESARNYSGNDIPYLQSVTSPEKDTKTEKVATQRWSAAELKAAQITRNDSGRVEQVTIGGKKMTGRELREALQLRSTDFLFKTDGNELVVTTRGYGHGVGMSQLGAQQMALDGKQAEQILQHYYTGVKISKSTCKN